MNMTSNTMSCPIDGTALVPNERQGIEIDYCPKCRGVWLDRGELDKIIERATPQPVMPTPHQPYDAPRGHQERHGEDNSRYRPKKKREGFLGDIFDF